MREKSRSLTNGKDARNTSSHGNLFIIHLCKGFNSKNVLVYERMVYHRDHT